MKDNQQALHSMTAVPLEALVKEEYRTYQIYTLMDRAIPYLQDGLKPSQRRILFTLWKNSNKGLIKVSSLTGLVLTLHPHGPASVEQSIVNLAQDYTFSNNYPLIDKKGYFGERMETQAAAARYIECKLGKVAELLLFDDMNQVEMVPNYDEKVMEPMGLLPKLPIMLLNGAEGIGTGFSSVIPSFNHEDIIKSMISFIETGKIKKIKPYFRYYTDKVEIDEKGRIITKMSFKQVGEKIFITEVPKGYDAQKIYRHLNKHMDNDFLKDYIDSSVDNVINVELIFKRGQTPTLEEVEKTMGTISSIVPNYTLITEKGVKVFNAVEEILEVFTVQRLAVTKRRYELLIKDYEDRLTKNNEIIRFIREKHYAIAEKKANRKDYIDYLTKQKFTYAEYLADMAIYRMTKEEVEKRQLLIKEETNALNEFKKVLKSPEQIKKKLIEELEDTGKKLSAIMNDKEAEKKKNFAKAKAEKTKTRH
ncbi:DNA gyrase subunit A [Peredibacter sp. HCB2-198]|uniref:DNA gyrase subunit A n=1 Tax=Peredibacter sp. HCB2-198 TaxID=3383025 RepID=UPI0038B45F6D